jgi:hypothetical protein
MGMGIQNQENCSYMENDQKIEYNQNGLITDARISEKGTAKRILLLGDAWISQEMQPPEMRLASVLETRLNSSSPQSPFQVFNGGIREAKLMTFSNVYTQILDTYQPHLVVLVISSPDLVWRDYLDWRKFYPACPVFKMAALNTTVFDPQIFYPTMTEIKKLETMSQRRNVKFSVLWILDDFSKTKIFELTPGCEFIHPLFFHVSQPVISQQRIIEISASLGIQSIRFLDRSLSETEAFLDFSFEWLQGF